MGEKLAQPKVELFLDSGAFSAWTKGTEIRLDDYIHHVHMYKHLLTTYANLDDLTSPEKTWENQREMEAQGLSPLPVYHVGEPLKYLDKAMEYEYFAVGGMALSSSLVRSSQFDNVFSILCPKSNGYYPLCKVHGFGLTAGQYLWRYPWYSVDSTSWVAFSKYGLVLVPKTRNGVYDYWVPPHTISVSDREGSAEKANDHYDNLLEIMQGMISRYFDEKGFTRDSLAQINLHRDILNLMYYIDAEYSMPDWPWQFRTATLIPPQTEGRYLDRKMPKGRQRGYYAGNFPMLSKYESEKESCERILSYRPYYRRLITYYYPKHLQTVYRLKEEMG